MCKSSLCFRQKTVELAKSVLAKSGPLKERIIKRTTRDTRNLAEQIAAQATHIAALQAKEREIAELLNSK